MRSDKAQRVLPSIGSTAVPTDLLLVGGVFCVTYLLIAFGVEGALQIVASAVLLWWVPGYVTLAALFPRSPAADADGTVAVRRHLTGWTRGVLSLGVSLALQVLLGLALGQASTLGVPGTVFTAGTVLNATAVYVVGAGVVAVRRRLSVPAGERVSTPVGRWAGGLRDALTQGPVTDRLLTLGLVCSVLLCAGTFGAAVSTGVSGQTYTDFHLLTADGNDTYVSGEYPEQLVEDERATLSWGIRNEESARTTYTVVVVLERVVESDGERVVIESVETNRTSVTVADGEHVVRDHTISPTLVGENLRLRYYLYRGDAPERVNATSAYRHLHIWLSVEPSE